MEFYVATRRAVAFAVAFAVVQIGASAWAAWVANVPRTLQASGVIVTGVLLGLLELGVVLGVLITTVFWIYASVRPSREHGRPAYGHLGYYGIGAFFVLFLLGYLVPGGVWVTAAVRILGCALLVAGVVHSSRWLRARSDPDRPYAADHYSMVTGGHPAAPLAAQPSAEDWDASQWDPAVQEDIERRRRW